MAHILNTATSFVADAIEGFADIHAAYVTAVPGGVVRSTASPRGKVAVIVGGGSGHYPAFAGYVGPGFSDGAVMGDLFASPSTRQAQDLCRLAEHGGGVLLTFGNYAGDVLNFTLAADRLRRDGVEAEIALVTDDIASAPADRPDQRRGIAGTVVVTKVASAAAEAGRDLAAVADLARRVNANTRTLGVAFAGCSLPGADGPLFTVPEGRMATGLGIHGEPGIDEVAMPTAAELAQQLVDGVLAEQPEGSGARVAVILNGLGSTKAEELFVLWSAVAPRLREAGLTLVAPEVGELITSLDMAGVSLTISWLDDETEPLWAAPGQCPAMSRGERIATEPAAAPDLSRVERDASDVPEADDASRTAAAVVADLVEAIAAALDDAEEELGDLDAIAGDGDHGRGMARGSGAAAQAARSAVEAGAGARTTLAAAADGWADKAGGTSGALWGVGLLRWSDQLSDTGAPDAAACAAGARAALEGIVELGSAKAGDKTLVDALIPFVETFEHEVSEGRDSPAAWRAAAQAATEAADATAELTPRLGRARPLAERSKGHPDAGAVSLALVARTVAEHVVGSPADTTPEETP